MEKVSSWDRKIVISELTQGRDLASELKNQLQPAKSREACQHLVEKILSSYDNALSLLNCMALIENPSQGNGLLRSASPRSSDGSDLIDSKDLVIKKRKTLAKWSAQVRVGCGTGLEGPFDDGYNWRKYGQKDIFGAKFPRAYYRCTHRHTQGCLATKQIQKTDEDTSLFKINYKGRHSCIRETEKQKKENSLILKKEEGDEEEIQRHEAQQKMIILKNESLELDTKEEIFTSFEFPEPVNESNFSASYSPSFLSPATSESYFSRMNHFEIHHNLRTSESDFTKIISDPTSVTNSPFEDLDLSIDPGVLDPKFLDTLEYF
ncbi:probable WRKY transcription factor 30 [Olea europaea var. sylvestris]|uniref:Probable WRKY transcription factor 46 n=1 Tax=Olea europaea subsp. europaea TaxID=158383 RepID=A0A8S0QIK9_OLEEU|nr:probable WRKY transcription factor 30 [Olea europaea var. sylvestris]CAA2965375.1 probable WRKY transcription factor 46 [Olea europaea subsp. europaea]